MNTPSTGFKPDNKKRIFEVSIDADFCKGCDICVDFCPKSVYGRSERINARGYYQPIIVAPGECTGCKLCGLLCPEMAIVIMELDK